ncbi:MAG: hypothetical protein GY757_04500 [bacterium]|nr:hypothetical protein [bacterium]
MTEPKLGKEKLYMIRFKNNSHEVPVVAESPEDVKKIVAKEGKYNPDDIEEIIFKQSYYAWDYKIAGVYGPSDDDWNLD